MLRRTYRFFPYLVWLAQTWKQKWMDGLKKLTPTAQQEQQENPGWKCANSFCSTVFDPGGMILLLKWLLSHFHTIHNLETEGVVFDLGKMDVLRLINAANSWSEAGERKVMEGWVYASPVAVQAQGRCHLKVILSHHSYVFSLSPQSLRTSFSKGRQLIRANGGVTWQARRQEKARRRSC